MRTMSADVTSAAATLSLALAAAGLARASTVNPLADFNGITFQDFRTTADVEGRLLVGRDLLGSGTLAKNLSATNTDTTIVRRNVNGSFNLQAGNLRLGGTRTGSFNFNGGGTTVADASIGNLVADVESQLRTLSAGLAATTANSVFTLPSGQPAGVTFNAAPNAQGVAIFNVSGDLFSSNLVQSIDIALNNAAEVIINVSGTNINVSGGNFTNVFNSFQARSSVLWNFYEAETLNIDRAFSGSILAPDAHLTGNSPIDGSVAVFSANFSGELHLAPFTGSFDPFIPAPGVAPALAAAGLVAARRRRA